MLPEERHLIVSENRMCRRLAATGFLSQGCSWLFSHCFQGVVISLSSTFFHCHHKREKKELGIRMMATAFSSKDLDPATHQKTSVSIIHGPEGHSG